MTDVEKIDMISPYILNNAVNIEDILMDHKTAIEFQNEHEPFESIIQPRFKGIAVINKIVPPIMERPSSLSRKKSKRKDAKDKKSKGKSSKGKLKSPKKSKVVTQA